MLSTMPSAIVSASIRPDQHDELKKIAAIDDRSVSSLVRIAIDQFLIAQTRNEPPTAGA